MCAAAGEERGTRDPCPRKALQHGASSMQGIRMCQRGKQGTGSFCLSSRNGGK